MLGKNAKHWTGRYDVETKLLTPTDIGRASEPIEELYNQRKKLGKKTSTHLCGLLVGDSSRRLVKLDGADVELLDVVNHAYRDGGVGG